MVQMIENNPTVELENEIAVKDMLVIVDAENKAHRHPLNKAVVNLGRSAQNDIPLNHGEISRHHLRLQQTNEGWAILDLNSTNGVFMNSRRLPVNTPVEWGVEQAIRVGPYYLSWYRQTNQMLEESEKEDTQEKANGVASEATPPRWHSANPVEENQHYVLASLQPERLLLEGGSEISADLEIFNSSITMEQFSFRVEGIPQTWLTFTAPSLVLNSRERGHTMLKIALPANGGVKPGSYRFKVLVESVANLQASTSVSAELVVSENKQFEIRVEPHGEEIYAIHVVNCGNVPDIYQLQAESVDDLLLFDSRQWQMPLTPGTQDKFYVHISPRKRGLLGRASTVPFRFIVQSNSATQHTYRGDFTLRPLVRIG